MNVYVLLIFGMILWGMYPIITHYFVETIDPLFLASITVFLSSTPFIAKVAIKNQFKNIFSQKIALYFLPIAFSAGLAYIFLFFGTSLTTGTNTGILLQVEPLYALLIGVMFFGEKLGFKRIIATLIMVIGAMIIIYKGSSSANHGDVLILLTTLMYQISHAFAKKLLDRGYDKSLILGVRQFIAGITLILFFILTNNTYISFLTNSTNLQIGLFLGLYQGLVTFIWYTVIKKIPLSRASSFLPLTAIVALLGSFLFLNESISIQQISGLILILIGMLWLTSIRH